jgi:hypothetical protein
LNLSYLIPRLVRHFLPDRIVRGFLLRNIIIQSGMETSDPFAAVRRYNSVLVEKGMSFQDKTVLVFGYGGRFDIGLLILREGAKHVILCDKYAPPDEAHNQRMFSGEDKYFSLENNKLRPRKEWMTLLEEDVRNLRIEPVDIILSSSVYEHVDDVEGVTRALAEMTKPDSVHVHYIDLRDHFFKYPFEMLRFSDGTWRNWLNPSSNHNRYRLWNYRKAFETCFERVEIKILSSEEEAFRRIQPHIRPEFVSGNMEEDVAGTIRVIASMPRKS